MNSFLVTVTQLLPDNAMSLKSKTSVAEACQIGQIIGDFLRISHPIRYLDLLGNESKILSQVHHSMLTGFQRTIGIHIQFLTLTVFQDTR